MATNFPPPELSSGWAESGAPSPSNSNNNNNSAAASTGFELGLSGMNLNGNRTSTTTPPPHGLPSSGDSVHSHYSGASYTGTGGGGGSVASGTGGGGGGLSRPPGLLGIPSHSNNTATNHKPGHTKNAASTSSSTAQTSTLTPTSSLDGGTSADLYGLNTSRQSSTGGGGGGVHSPNSAATMSDHLPGIASLGGSFDRDDHDNRSNDGLLGLQALRDRAHSSPGPLSSSPASASVHSYSTSPRNLVPQPPVRPRTVSRDGSRSQSTGGPSTRRPPLAGGSALSPLSSSALHHLAGGGAPSANSSGSSSRDASPPPNAGIIARPPESYSPYDGGRHHGPGGGGLDSSLRRALINERGSGGADGGFINDNKFHTGSPFSSPHPSGGSVGGGGPSRGGNLPSSLQGGPGVFQPQQHRHQRSQSQPGPRMAPTDYYTGPQDNLGGYGGGDVTVHQHNRRSSDYGSGYHGGPNGGIDSEYGNHFNDGQYGAGGGHHPRSLSMQHSSNSYVSDPNFQEMNRRGSTVYYGGRGGGGRDRDYDGGYDDHYNFQRQDRLVSPAHSPHQASYGGHSRQSSMGTTLSSSPMSMSSGQQYGRRRDLGHGNSEEDLSHPLAGENIEVPGEDQYYNDMPAPYSRSHSMGAGPAYRGDSRHLGTSGMGLPPPIRAVYNVKFKRTQRPFEIGPRLTRDLKVGTYVKVEADRGEDLGIVVGLVKGTHRSSSFGGGMDELPTAGAAGMPHDQKKIIRLATHDEVALLQIKRDEEDELLRVCRMKVRQRGLPMNVVDAEYQFDRHKLTFFFEAEGRVDFRELVRDLFSIYKTRIWMQQLDKSISASCPVAPEPDPLMMDQGTPIIAPAHEYEDFAASSVVPEDTYGGNHDYM